MKLISLNRSRVQALTTPGGVVQSGIRKRPVEGPVEVRLLGLEGDEQADLTVHGGLSKAVYAYPQEHYGFWQTVRAQARVALWDDALEFGSLGENLTIQGVTEDRLWIGDRLLVGGTADAPGCVLAVSEPRFPCFKFTATMGFGQAGKLMVQSGYCGAYLGVIDAGTVQAGDTITLVPGPREVNLRELFKARMGA